MSEELNTQAQPEQATEQQPAQTPAAKPAPVKNDPPAWVTRRFGDLTRKRHEAESRAETLARENEELRRALSTQKPASGDGSQPQQQPPARSDDSRIETRAQELSAQERFNEKCNSVADTGDQTFPDFQDKMKAIGQAGDITPDFLAAVVDSPIAHEILYHLGDNPDEAARILDMSPQAQARAIGRLESKLEAAKEAKASESNEEPESRPAQPAPQAQPSKAPAPVKPVGTRGPTSTSSRPTDKDDTATWMRKRNEEIAAQRNARRR